MVILPNKLKYTIVFSYLLSLVACSLVTYTPRIKKQKQREKPSIVLLNNIIDFRETYDEWPVTLEHFSNHNSKYKESIKGFKYQYTKFKIINNDRMVFYFSDL